jgi:seryl-tRNA synthetase
MLCYACSLGRRCGIKKTGEREKKYVHMLNSTLCATGRAICCLLETYQEADGVRVPEVLVPYMGGMDFLPFVREPRPRKG